MRIVQVGNKNARKPLNSREKVIKEIGITIQYNLLHFKAIQNLSGHLSWEVFLVSFQIAMNILYLNKKE